MREYRNFIVLGALFAICFIGAVHGSHDGDKELLNFSIDSAKQILAALLTVITVGVGMRRTDHNGGNDGKKNGNTGGVVPSGGHN